MVGTRVRDRMNEQIIADKLNFFAQSLGDAEPAFAVGLGDAVVQVGPDLLEPSALGGVRPQERAPDTSVLMNAG